MAQLRAAPAIPAAPTSSFACSAPSRRRPLAPAPPPGYTHERYREIIHSIRRHMPDASVSGDAIVGFPGETEEQFERTVALVEEVGFDRVNTGAPACCEEGWRGAGRSGACKAERRGVSWVGLGGVEHGRRGRSSGGAHEAAGWTCQAALLAFVPC